MGTREPTDRIDAETWVPAPPLPATEVGPDEAPAALSHPTPTTAAPPHLELVGRIGAGGMGEVWLALDRRLRCPVALKTLRADRVSDDLRQRFVDEACLTARLQHPGIVAVHEIGELPDGRPYYTMKRVEGLPLSRILAGRRAGEPGAVHWTRRALARVLQRVCEAVGYAHAQGVVHRDLKPDNVRVGAHGEVVVLDWGLARALDAEQDLPARSGTPGYMAPEQRLGQPSGRPADVYALGVILQDVLDAAEGTEAEDDTLQRLSAAATAEDPADRPASADVVAARIEQWLDGARRREQALELVERADALAADIQQVHDELRRLEGEAERLTQQVAPWAPETEKASLWDVEEAADQARRRADRLEVEWAQTLHAALTYDADLPDARERLARWYRRLHEQAEEARDPDAPRWEYLLRVHQRGEHADYLDGLARLSVRTDPPGAQVELCRYVERRRRLVPVVERDLGTTPIVEAPVRWGSVLLRISAPGHATVVHPLALRRLEHADGVPPGGEEPVPIRLPRPGELPDDCVLVTPGWSVMGGDDQAIYPQPRQRVWVDGFLIQRTPVTNQAYLAFLNDLVASGASDVAERCVPRERAASGGAPGARIYGFDGTRYHLQPDAQGDVWRPEWPVIMIDYASAERYADWRTARDPAGRVWRLPREDEWERAARGADGRFFPWGDHLDPTWACYRGSHPEGVRPQPPAVGSYPVDTSPFGVLDLGGGVREWCVPVFEDEQDTYGDLPVVRGGAWNLYDRLVRCATRSHAEAADRHPSRGFRVVASWP